MGALLAMALTQVFAVAEARADAAVMPPRDQRAKSTSPGARVGHVPASGGPVHVFVAHEEVALDVAVLGALLRMELGAPVLMLGPDGAGAPVRTVHISRVGIAGSAGRLHIRVDPGGEATIEVGALPLEARPRALALAIAELFARTLPDPSGASLPGAVASAPAVEEPPVSTDPGASAQPEVLAAPSPSGLADAAPARMRPFGELGLGLRAFPSYTTVATELRGALTVGWVKVDLGGTLFQTTDPLGRVTVAAPSAGVGAAMQGRAGSVALAIGPRFEGGVIFATSQTSNPDAQSRNARALLLSAGVAASAAIPLEGHHRAVVSLHLGHVLAGADVRAGDRRAGGIGGPVLGLGVGYGR